MLLVNPSGNQSIVTNTANSANQPSDSSFNTIFNQQFNTTGLQPSFASQGNINLFAMVGQDVAAFGMSIPTDALSNFGDANPLLNAATTGIQNLFAQMFGLNTGDSPSTELASLVDESSAAELDSGLTSSTDPLNLLDNPEAVGNLLGEKVVSLSEDGYDNLDFSVNHAIYGPIDVDLNIDGQAVELTLATDNEELAASLQQAESSLRTYLEDNGLTLNQFTVNNGDGGEQAASVASTAETTAIPASSNDQLLNAALTRNALGLINA